MSGWGAEERGSPLQDSDLLTPAAGSSGRAVRQGVREGGRLLLPERFLAPFLVSHWSQAHSSQMVVISALGSFRPVKALHKERNYFSPVWEVDMPRPPPRSLRLPLPGRVTCW